MKNLKNTLTAAVLMAVLGMGATVAKAGLLISDKATPADDTQCKVNDAKSDIKGFILVGLNGFILVGVNGLILSDGLIISDRKCEGDGTAKDGLLISD